MPELPEVETTRRGLEPHVLQRTVEAVVIRQPRLRWPVPADLAARLSGASFVSVGRRGKYLLFETGFGTLIVHLGMSGSLRVLQREEMPRLHDHIDICFDDGSVLRFHDPRRFGSLHWTSGPSADHPLLRDLGPEPLGNLFDGRHLYERSRGRRLAVKSFIMDAKVVVGVGNIYASESLHLAGLSPVRAAGRISLARYDRLADCIRQVLGAAIMQGGTTLRDFVNGVGEPGYFAQSLRVYGRAGELCAGCGQPIRARVIGQRASYYCAHCQR
ncbi:MAG: bifunctional DNA-formamidopyrimidine glycosylase/DNA-(apurinic or apyrimidinic site) lyase [Gammaproteobacteria bacterium]|nr:bifunctional DNA-formamidopyrimidine glycosylase/DNA-(apurinic or apyrimidinic site) lyase [Gammaproteobacteria bacterium]